MKLYGFAKYINIGRKIFMRRSDREIKKFSEVIDVLSRCDTIRLGISGDIYPYVVPLSFGYEIDGERIAIYFHGAKEGMKHELIAKNNNVCIEASIFHKFTELPQFGIVTTEYESFIGFGTAKTVSGGEAVKGLNLICEHAGFKDFDFGGENVLDAVKIYKIEIEKFSGKRRLVP